MGATAAARSWTGRTGRLARRGRESRRSRAGTRAKARALPEAGTRTHAGALSWRRRAAGLRARGMHGAPDTGLLRTTHAGTRTSRPCGCAGGPTIENGSSALNSARSSGPGGWRRRCAVNRPRPGLGHDDAARRRRLDYRSFHRGRSGLSYGSLRSRGRGYSDGGRSRRRGDRRWSNNRANGGRGGGHGAILCNGSGRGSDGRPGDNRSSGRTRGNGRSLRGGGHDGPCGTRCSGRRSYNHGGSRTGLRNDPARSGLRVSNGGCGGHRRIGSGRRGRWSRRRSDDGPGRRRRDDGWRRDGSRRNDMRDFLMPALKDRLGGIARLGNARPVDLWPGLCFVAGSAGGRTTTPEDIGAHTLGLIPLDRAGMRLLFGHADCRQSIENLFALDLQLAR